MTRGEREETDWNDHVDFDLVLLEDSTDFLSEEVTHRHSTPVDRDPIEYRVGTGEVDVFKNVGCEDLVFDELSSRNCCTRDDDGLSCRRSMRSVRKETGRLNRTCPDVFPMCKSCGIGDYALTSEEVILPCIRRGSRCDSNGSYPTGVPKGNDTKPSEHCNTSIRPLALVHHGFDCGENVFFVDPEFARQL